MRSGPYVEEKDRRLLRLVGSLSTVGIAMVASTVIGYFIGLYLDRFFSTSPWCTIIFLVLGIIAGFKNLFDQARKIQNLDRPDGKGSHEGS
ncbi:MAG: AtpZ/AtpI family protein [Nitrospirota bacterium]|nr:AtpZ/AtpI family protein [Nitrospirota bacterium]